MRRNSIKIVFLALSAATGTWAQAAGKTIPGEFHGVWGSPAACKTYREQGITDQGFEVTSSSISQYETSCSPIALSKSSATEVAGTFTCTVEGNDSREKIRLRLINGALSYNGNTPLPRCK